MAAFFLVPKVFFAQTTFTESAAAYGLNLGTGKDGGHAWSDFDNDGVSIALLLTIVVSHREYNLARKAHPLYGSIIAIIDKIHDA